MVAVQTGKQTGNAEEPGDLSDIKRKLAWRMGIAGLMIVGLLGGLALFDRLSAPSAPEPAEPQFTEAVPVAKKVVTQPVTPADPSTEAAKAEVNPSLPESSAAPVDKSATTLEPPPPPVVSAQPALPRASQPAARAIAPGTPSASTKPPVSANATAKTAEPKPEVPSTPAVAEPTSKPLLSKLLSGFAVQAGVFSDPRRAEELQAKLLQEGIPSSIEARVEVGPFKTRAEAQAAREKMKAIGIDTVLLLPKGTKR